jgi:hypothetical protein
MKNPFNVALHDGDACFVSVIIDGAPIWIRGTVVSYDNDTWLVTTDLGKTTVPCDWVIDVRPEQGVECCRFGQRPDRISILSPKTE